MVSDEVQRGRELAALAIEDEAQAYESQCGVDGLGGHAAGVLCRLRAARVSHRGALPRTTCARTSFRLL